MQSARLERKKILPKYLEPSAQIWREQGFSIATLNGSFDLLHAGHLVILEEAAQQADLLLVALNSDESIRKYKGPHRPLIPLEQRLLMICALEMVDYVTWFSESDPRKFLLKVKPDVHINGAEYGSDCIEAETVRSFGGRLHLVERVPKLATSLLIEKIQQCASLPA